MRTKKELNSKEFRDNLKPLYNLLVKHKIPCELKAHKAVELEPQVKKLIGYFPTGRYQIIIKRGNTTYSVIRGMVSFGDYEIMNISTNKFARFKDPERFKTAQQLINALIN